MSSINMGSMRKLLVSISVLSTLITTTFAQAPAAGSTATVNSPSAQATTLPSCAKGCVGTATASQSCAPSDQACLCAVSTQISQDIYQCLSTTTCNDDEKQAAIGYYPAYCKGLNLAVETKLPTMVAAASGAPSTISTPDTSGSSNVDAAHPSETNKTPGKNIHAGLQLPAILGIVLVVIIMVVGVGALLLWSCLRRRQMARRPRMDLGGEFADPKPRPSRSKSMNSEFMVQPSPVEKDVMGSPLSRSSTLVPPPPIAKDEKHASQEKRHSARAKALKLLMGHDGLRSSFMSSKSGSKKSSLVVPPLNVNKADEGQYRASNKF